MFKDKKSQEQIAKEAMDKISAEKAADAAAKKAEDEKEGKPQADPTDPSPEELKAAEEKKKQAEATKETERIEAEAKKDEQLLNASKEEVAKLSEEDKARLQELTEKQGKSKVQKRFDELTRQRKEETERADRSEARIAELEREIKEISQEVKPSSDNIIAEKEQVRIDNYLKEDVAKPLAQRREMTKAELEDFVLEDSIAANEFIVKRTLRRDAEKKDDVANIAGEKAAEDLFKNQKPYMDESLKLHPELDTTARVQELTTQGKGPKEIFDTLCKENPKYNVVQQILSEKPELLLKVDGPMLVVKEMGKRLKGKKSKADEDAETKAAQEERDRKLQEDAAEKERQRKADADAAASDKSSRGPINKNVDDELIEAEKKICKKTGISEERLKARKKIRAIEGQ